MYKKLLLVLLFVSCLQVGGQEGPQQQKQPLLVRVKKSFSKRDLVDKGLGCCLQLGILWILWLGVSSLVAEKTMQ